MKRLQYPWLIELLLLVVVLACIRPTGGAPAPALDTRLRDVSLHQVSVALGWVHRRIYPCFSLPFAKALADLSPQDLSQAYALDLRAMTDPSLWPRAQADALSYQGAEAAPFFLTAWLWEKTGQFTMMMLFTAMSAVHLLTVLLLFFLLVPLKKTGLPLLGSLILAYSPLAAALVTLFSVYFFPLFFVVLGTALTMAARHLFTRSSREFILALTLVTLAGTAMAVGTVLRTSILFSAFVLGGIILASLLKRPRGRAIALTVCFALSLTLSLHLLNQKIWTPERLAFNRQKGHVFWHPLWCGLGEFPNPYGFVWSDRQAWDFARTRQPDVAFASPQYEAILREHLLKTAAHHPLWLAGVITKRGVNVLDRWIEVVPGGRGRAGWFSRLLGLGGLLGFFWLAGKSKDERAELTFLPFLTDWSIPLLIYSAFDPYNLVAYFSIALMLAYVLSHALGHFVRR